MIAPGVATATSSPWLLTASGRRFDLRDPRPEDVQPEDLAHALAHLCRFGGHTRVHYSVAQHCVLVSTLVPASLALAGLLHDAAEAYVGDLIAPLRAELAAFRAIETRVLSAVAERFAVPRWHLESHEVRDADRKALAIERTALLPPHDDWPSTAKASLEPWPAPIARVRFLGRLRSLACPRPGVGRLQ